MHHMDLRSWRAWLGLSQLAAALELGICERQFKRYESGVVKIPRYIEMACVALQMGARRYVSQVYSHLDDPVMPLDWLRGFAISLTGDEIKILSRILSGTALPVPTDHLKAMRFSGRLMRLEMITTMKDPASGREVFAATERGRQMHALMVDPKLVVDRDPAKKRRGATKKILDELPL